METTTTKKRNENFGERGSPIRAEVNYLINLAKQRKKEAHCGNYIVGAETFPSGRNVCSSRRSLVARMLEIIG